MRSVGIRTHDPSKSSAADLRLRPRGHSDRPKLIEFFNFQTNERDLDRVELFRCYSQCDVVSSRTQCDWSHLLLAPIKLIAYLKTLDF
jgi:hypothetical protein